MVLEEASPAITQAQGHFTSLLNAFRWGATLGSAYRRNRPSETPRAITAAVSSTGTSRIPAIFFTVSRNQGGIEKSRTTCDPPVANGIAAAAIADMIVRNRVGIARS